MFTRMRAALRRYLVSPSPERPLWQKVLLPFLGVLCMVVGIIGWIMPVIPGFPLVFVGLPLLCCVRREWEDRAKAKVRGLRDWCKARMRRLREHAPR